MPNVGDIIRAADFSGAGIKAGAVVPFYNVTLSGRYPIFWAKPKQILVGLFVMGEVIYTAGMSLI